MNTQGSETAEKAGASSSDSALKPKAPRRRLRIGVTVFVLLLWLIFGCALYLSRGSLASAYFWAAFIAFAVSFSVGALSGDPNPPPNERGAYPLQFSRRQHFVIGVLGMAILATFVIVLNSPIEKDVKWDVLYGGGSGGVVAIALSGTYLEFIRRGRKPR